MDYYENLFNLFFQNSVKNTYFHIVLILFENYPLSVFTVNTLPKIKHYISSVEDFRNTDYYFSANFPMKYFYNKNINQPIIFVLLILCCFFSFSYYALALIKNKTTRFFVANFYDLIFFRYFSFYFMSVYSNVVFNPDNPALIRYFSFFFLIFYVIQITQHYFSIYSFFSFSNKTISDNEINYPFDSTISLKINSINIFKKLAISLELSHFQYLTKEINSINLCLNLMIVLINLFQIYTLVLVFWIDFSLTNFIINNTLNFFQISLILYSFLRDVFTMIFVRHDTKLGPVVIINFISLFWAVYILIFYLIKKVRNSLLDEVLSPGKLFYVVSKGNQNSNKDNQRKKSRSFFTVNSCDILANFIISHEIQCEDKNKSCKICQMIKQDKEDKTKIEQRDYTLYAIKLFKHFFQSNSAIDKIFVSKMCVKQFLNDKQKRKKEINFCIDIFLLLIKGYFNKKTYRFLTLYKLSLLIEKMTYGNRCLNMNIRLFVKTIISKKKDLIQMNFNQLFPIIDLNQKVINALKELKMFVKSPKEIIKYSKIFEISSLLKEIKSTLPRSVLKIERLSNSDGIQDDKFIFQIKSIYKYNLLLERFIIETLLNHIYSQLPVLNMDVYEEYLSLHFYQDKFLVLGLDLSQEEISSNEESINILKTDKDLIDYEGKELNAIFPKIFHKNGENLFKLQLRNFAHNEGLFEYIFVSCVNKEIEHLKYSFKISPYLERDNMIIYGFYKNGNHKLMIFCDTKSDYKNLSQYSLFFMSSVLQDILFVKNEWIKILEANDFNIHFEDIFQTILSTTGNDNGLECIVKTESLVKNLQKAINVLLKSNELKENTKEKDKIVHAFEVLKQGDKSIFRIEISLLFNLKSDRNELYKVFTIKKIRKQMGKKGKFETNICNSTFKDLNLLSDAYAQEVNLDIDKIFQRTNIDSLMTTSTTNKTTTTFGLGLKPGHDDYGLDGNLTDKRLVKIRKTFFCFSLSIIGLSLLVIVVCILFLFMQIEESNRLKMLNSIFFMFTKIRIFFSHSFLSVFSNVCLCTTSRCNFCSNSYKNFSEKKIKDFGLTSDLSLRDLIIQELPQKVISIKEMFDEYKSEIFKFKDKTLLNSLKQEMNYYDLSFFEGKVSLNKKVITLEEGIRNFMNSVSILAASDPYFDETPVVLLNYSKGEIDFGNLSPLYIDSINENQRETYSALTNYLFYSNTYTSGEQILTNTFNKLRRSTKIKMISFMIVICGLNAIICALCFLSLFVVQRFFSDFVESILTATKEKQFVKFFKKKIRSLSILSKMYVQNPGKIIKSLQNEDNENTKRIKKAEKQSKKNVLQFEETRQPLISKKTEKKEVNRMNDIANLLTFFYFIISAVFLVYLALVIVFDVVLIYIYEKYKIISSYGLVASGIERNLFGVMCTEVVSTLINTTNEELSSILETNVDEEGDDLINQLIKEVYTQIEQARYLENENGDVIKPLAQYFEYDCARLYRGINDSLINNLIEEIGVDYYPLYEGTCKYYQILKQPNFNYLINIILLEIENLSGTLVHFTYQELFEFNRKDEFYNTVTMILVNFRPIRNRIRNIIIDEMVSDALIVFVKMLWFYLWFNAIINIIIFFIIKKLIIDKLNLMNNNLNLLNKCFNLNSNL